MARVVTLVFVLPHSIENHVVFAEVIIIFNVSIDKAKKNALLSILLLFHSVTMISKCPEDLVYVALEKKNVCCHAKLPLRIFLLFKVRLK